MMQGSKPPEVEQGHGVADEGLPLKAVARMATVNNKARPNCATGRGKPPGYGQGRPGLSRRTDGPEHHADAEVDDGEDCQLRTRSR
jgi:hypothetical protein